MIKPFLLSLFVVLLLIIDNDIIHYILIYYIVNIQRMDFLEISDLSTQKSVSFDSIIPNVDKLIERFTEVRNYVPKLMKKRGDRMVQNKTNARIVMSFIRFCARRAKYSVLVQKRTLHRENLPNSTYCIYRLVPFPEMVIAD